MEFSRPDYWSGWLFPSPGDLPNPGVEPRSPTLEADSLPAEPQGVSPAIDVYKIISRSAVLCELGHTESYSSGLREKLDLLHCYFSNGSSDSKESTFHPWVRKIPWHREWLPTPVFLPGKSLGQRSQAGYSPVQFSHFNSLHPINCSMPSLPVHHQLPESTQTHVH